MKKASISIMANTRALLVMTSPLRQVNPKLASYLPTILSQNHKTLYIHLTSSESNPALLSNTVTNIYKNGTMSCPQVDLRVTFNPVSLDLIQRPVHEIFCEESSGVEDSLVKLLHASKVTTLDSPKVAEEKGEHPPFEVYDNVCLGGTFDRIHNGHKILLTNAILRCKKKITVGVTDASMIKSKKLSDLIQDTETRMAEVSEFLHEVRGLSDNFVTPISDPFGPAITDETLQCIVGSDETKRGCEKINEIRAAKGLPTLDIHLIKLVDDACLENAGLEETKISSSNGRIRLLGHELKPPYKPPSLPYIIGLTGGSASGKTSIAKYLETLGAGIVDCDKLGHKAYEPGTDCYTQIVRHFGQDLVNKDGTIDRRLLGQKVFADQGELRKLESMVWPEILKLAKEQMIAFFEDGTKIVILDAAVLIKAGWDSEGHQIWGAFIDREEAINRIVARDSKSAQEASNRIDNQLSNRDLIGKCNVVFYTKWDVSQTRSQVDKAWKRVQKLVASV